MCTLSSSPAVYLPVVPGLIVISCLALADATLSELSINLYLAYLFLPFTLHFVPFYFLNNKYSFNVLYNFLGNFLLTAI